MDNNKEILILVDRKDRPVGTMIKKDAHQLPGFLHRAFLVMFFNSQGKLLLTKRSDYKPLWPGVWDGSIASHPRMGEELEGAVKRRLIEELGIINPIGLKKLFKFEYEARWKKAGIEKEICTVFKTIYEGEIKPSPQEVDGFYWISPEDLSKKLKESPEKYSPWLKKALAKYINSTK